MDIKELMAELFTREPEGQLHIINASASLILAQRGKAKYAHLDITADTKDEVENFYAYLKYLLEEVLSRFDKKILKINYQPAELQGNRSWQGVFSVEFITYVDGYPNTDIIIDNPHQHDGKLMPRVALRLGSDKNTDTLSEENMLMGRDFVRFFIDRSQLKGKHLVDLPAKDQRQFAEVVFTVSKIFDKMIADAECVPFTYNVYNPVLSNRGGVVGKIHIVFTGYENDEQTMLWEDDYQEDDPIAAIAAMSSMGMVIGDEGVVEFGGDTGVPYAIARDQANQKTQ